MTPATGKVYLIGAGPGDPGLITVKGLEKLKQADVVVYDRLINDDLLSYCREGCERVFVGKESGYHPVEQELITDILIRKSRLGLVVARLKGGNPFVFGRGSEEAIALKEAGIDFEIIPGITSGLSAPIYSGIPITHRGLVTQCVLITAHESPDKPGTQVEWDKLARLKNTALVIYMGASRIENICKELIRHGADPSTPAAVIENGTLPKQRTITGQLDNIAGMFKANGFHAPAIIMISPTVAMREQLLWYESQPLFGKRVVLVGDALDIDRLRAMIYDMGGEALELSSTGQDQPPNVLPGHELSGVESNLGDGGTFPQVIHYRFDGLKEDVLPAITAQREPADITVGPRPEVLKDIRENGAHIFIFSHSSAVEYFFDNLGYHDAVGVLKHGMLVAMNYAAANSLVDRNIHNVIVPADGGVKDVRTLLLKHFRDSEL